MLGFVNLTKMTAGRNLPLSKSSIPILLEGQEERLTLEQLSSVLKNNGASDVPQGGTTQGVGTAAAGLTATEKGSDNHHITSLAVDTVLPAIAGGADLAVGVLAYTFPAGVIRVSTASIALAITQTDENITADTPDVGLGTVIASGAVATLDGTAAFENIMTGQTFDDCDGTVETKTLVSDFIIEAADPHTVYINVADGWAADGDAAAEITGTVILDWTKLS